jgi:hypothetical protein
LLVVVGANGDVELPLVTRDRLNSGVEAEGLLVRKGEGSKEFDKTFRHLIVFQRNILEIHS